MWAIRKNRLYLLCGVLSSSIAVVALVLFALQQNLNLFYVPAQIQAGEAPLGALIKLGGIVAPNSFQRHQGLTVAFALKDDQHTIWVTYQGVLPDLFREGQGLVVTGRLQNTTQFHATHVMAKHDENYKPPGVLNSAQETV